MCEELAHRPVLYDAVLEALAVSPNGCYVDATVGAGGHAWGILAASAPEGQLLGLDVDPDALHLAQTRLAPFGGRVTLVRGSFARLSTIAQSWECANVAGVLLDLGLSSMQLDTPERGFSLRHTGPLDMRFDPSGATTAADLVNGLDEAELADIFRRYGEETRARRIARAIVLARPLESTTQLAALIEKVVGHRGRIHPATRTFQALRIAVNGELMALGDALGQALDLLMVGGRLVVISFHSLEDRMVKQFLRREAQDCICPPDAPVCVCNHRARVDIVTRRAVRPTEQEVAANPRSRSARLRAAIRIEG